jgi:hypothetical protein
VRGAPVDEILDLAEELDSALLVTGSRRRSSVQRLLMGSGSEGIVHGTSSPVPVMRGGERAWPPQRIVFGDDGSGEAKRAGDLASIGGLYDAKGSPCEPLSAAPGGGRRGTQARHPYEN